MPTEKNIVAIIILAIMILFLVTLFIVNLAWKRNALFRDPDYINREIRRTSGAEQKRWKREKRRLLLSLLPFYRR